MLFSSISFLYYFLPIMIIIYFAVPNKFKNFVLLFSSLVFYFWGEASYTLIMVLMAFSGYIHGLLINKFRGNKLGKIMLVSSIVVGIGTLGLFKYSNFFIENINQLLNKNIALLGVILPIGISFYTFQILSYTVDVYRRKAEVQTNFIDFATYVMLFPQLIAGPIVRYVDVSEELKNRTHSFENAAYGINRFIIGLSKKVLIANVLGEFCEIAKVTNNPSVLFMWLYAISYALHIYFDFSGYSDMAIGLGRIFGFHFPENFNYPYISKSITEFWRRWHISLGTWFRDYVYIPLGGNRVSKLKWFRNIFIVWALTGFWHGANWNFIVWGLFFAVFLILEKAFLLRFMEKLPVIIKRLYVIILLLLSWVIFDSDTMITAGIRLKMMFGIDNLPLITPETLYYLSSYFIVFIIAIIGSTPLVKNIIEKVKGKENKIINVLEPIFQVAVLIIITAYLIDGSFNPFLYFRF